MPTSGVGCLTDQNYDETVNYTYNSSTQQITLLNLNFVHSNAMVFATGGLCGYAVEVAADIYPANSTGGQGVQSQVFPIEGSISTTTFYYLPRRTNEGYGPAILGLSTDQDQIGSGQLSFSTGSKYYSLGADGHTVTFTLDQPANVYHSAAIYNQLMLNISTPSNTTYSAGSPFQVTWVAGNTFTYNLATSPNPPTPPTGGTVSYSNLQYILYPAATILSAYNPSTSKIDGTVTVMPNTVAWASGDTIRVPHYQQMNVSGSHYAVNQWIPSQSLGGGGFDITYTGTSLSAGEWGFGIINNNIPSKLPSYYQGYGGTHVLPFEAEDIQGIWSNDFNITNLPDSTLINISGCKLVIGCSTASSNFNVFQMPTLPNSVPGYGVDVLNYDPNYQSAVRSQGLYSGRWYFGNQNTPADVEGAAPSVATIEAGYVVADQTTSSPSVSTSNLFTTQLTSVTVYPNAINTGNVTTNYWVVGNALSSVSGSPAQTLPISFSITNGSSTPDNLICFPPQAGWASYAVLKGNTSTLLGSVSATSPNGASQSPPQPANQSCIADTGQTTTPYTPPTTNTTGSGAFAGRVYANAGLVVGSGTPVTSIVYYSSGLTPTSVAADVCATQTFTVAGLQASDNIGSVKPPSGFPSSVIFQGYVSATGTLTIKFCNVSPSAVTPTAGMYSFLAMH